MEPKISRVALVNEYDDNECPTRSIIALVMTASMIGMSWYDELKNSIMTSTIAYSSEDLEDILTYIKIDCSPTLFILQSKIVANKQLLELILSKPLYSRIVEDEKSQYDYEVPKNSSWRADSAKDLICTRLHVRSLSAQHRESYNENYHKLCSKISIEDISVQQSLGSLLQYIQSHILLLDDDHITIASIGEYHMNKYMKVDENTLRSLQIFSKDVHPNLLKGQQKSKEGFSVFSLLDRAQSLGGRQKLKEWLSKPFYNRECIEKRLNFIETLMAPSNKDFNQEIGKLLYHMHDILKLILRIKKVEAKCSDWCKLHTSLEQGIQLIQVCNMFVRDMSRRQVDRENIFDLISCIDFEVISAVTRFINKAINFVDSAEAGVIVIKDGYDDNLDNLRNKLDSLDSVLRFVACNILETVPLISNLQVHYLAQIGYLVAIEAEGNHLSIIEGNSEFIFMYRQGNICYFKHPLVRELDDRFGDVSSDIKDRQKALMIEIEEQLIDAEESIQMMSIAFATLDAYLSLAVIASEMRYVRPEISNADALVIKNGRHPLQELTVDNFISNDTFISADKNVALITGPNNSGKSVYIKQVGIIVYLAHIGSFVPCERAIISLTDCLLTRISSIELTTSPLSSFSTDLTQVSKMFTMATKRSLCLLDEFGKGTTPVDGIAILAATIEYFAKMNVKILCALHFTEVLNPKLLPEECTERINTFRMDVHNDNNDINSDNNSDSPVQAPLYKLCLGAAPSSEGIPCARAAGLPDIIIDRAKVIKVAVQNRSPIEPLETENFIDHKHAKILDFFLAYEDWSDSNIVTDKVLQEFLILLT